MATFTEMMSKLVSANTASSSVSGTLPETKVTKDQVQNPSSQNTAPVQPSVIQSESQASVSEPVVSSVSSPMPNLKPSIPYPSRRDNEKRHDQANEQIENSGSGTLPGNTITNPKEDLKGIATRSGVAYQGPKAPSPSKQGTKVTKDQVQNPSSQNTAPVQPSVIQPKSQASISEPVVAPVSVPMTNLKPSIPYPSRHDNEKCCDQANEQIEKFYEIFKEMSFEISFTDALTLMPKFASTLKALIGN
nr:reverse transcriptase domain-containing protein [Tanacetum cinerariifolium]